MLFDLLNARSNLVIPGRRWILLFVSAGVSCSFVLALASVRALCAVDSFKCQTGTYRLTPTSGMRHKKLHRCLAQLVRVSNVFTLTGFGQ